MIILFLIVLATSTLQTEVGSLVLRGPKHTLAAYGQSRVTLHCQLAGLQDETIAKQGGHVQWLKNGQPLDIISPKYTTTGDLRIESNLEIRQLSWSDSGEYICSYTSPVYQKSLSARLLVASSPTCDIRSGAPHVELTCLAKYSGDWAPRLILQGDGKTLVTRVESTSVRLITTPGNKDSSNYTCTLEAFQDDILYGTDRLVGRVPAISNNTESCSNCVEEDRMALTCTKTATRPLAELKVSNGYQYRYKKREIGQTTVFQRGMYLSCETRPTGFWDITTEWIIPGSPGKHRHQPTLELETWMSGSYITCNITNSLGSSLVSTAGPVTVLGRDDLVYHNRAKDDEDTDMIDDGTDYWKRTFYMSVSSRNNAEWREGQLKRHLVIVSAVLGSLVLLGIFIFLVMAHGMRKLYIRSQAIEGKDTLLTFSKWKLLFFRACIWLAGGLACLAKKSAKKLSHLEKSAEAKMSHVEHQILLEKEQAQAVDGPHSPRGSPGGEVCDGNDTPTFNVGTEEENKSPVIAI